MEKARRFEVVLVLLLVVLTYLLFLAIASTPAGSGDWEAKVAEPSELHYLLAGSDDTLYVFDRGISAIHRDGSIAWALDLPYPVFSYMRPNPDMYPPPDSRNSIYVTDRPVACEQGGRLYLYTVLAYGRNDLTCYTDDYVEGNLSSVYSAYVLCIAPSGKIEWRCPVSRNLTDDDIYNAGPTNWYTGDNTVPDGVDLRVHDDRLYLFHDHSEDVLALNGTRLFTISDVAGPAAVNESGYVYAVRAEKPEIKSGAAGRVSPDPDCLYTTGIIDAYRPDGSLAWSRDTGIEAVPAFAWPGYSSLPLYSNHTLYVPIRNGVAAMSESGNILWIRTLSEAYSLFPQVPVDPEGNVYLARNDSGTTVSSVIRISPDGQTSSQVMNYDPYDANTESYPLLRPLEGCCGTLYAVGSTGPVDQGHFEGILSSKRYGADTLTAYDLSESRVLWNFTVPESDKHTIVLDRGNFGVLLLDLPLRVENMNSIDAGYPGYSDTWPLTPKKTADIRVYPGLNATFVYYYYSIHEDPVAFNRSRGIYVRALYALDDEGRLLWEKQVNGTVQQSAAGHETFYYSTREGKLEGSSVNGAVAAGLALTASLYLFLRFFAVGTVARAKAVLHTNDNRKELLNYVSANPGVTARDVSRALKMNMGTLRYHLFILTANHKLVTHSDGGKYIRYFKNSGAYTIEERTLLSLVRREPVARVLKALTGKPGLSGSELASTLGISETAAYRYANLLVEQGILCKEARGERYCVYTISDRYLAQVARVNELS